MLVTQTASQARLRAINTATATQVGTTISADGLGGGFAGGVEMSADGSRVVAISTTTSASGDSTTSHVTVLNTATGTQVGSTVSYTEGPYDPGNNARSLEVSADGSRAVLIISVHDAATNVNTIQAVTINSATGAKLGSAVALGTAAARPTDSTSGDFTRSTVQMTADGSRSFITLSVSTLLSSGQGNTTSFVVLNTTTGAQLGITRTFAGRDEESHASALGSETRDTGRIHLFARISVPIPSRVTPTSSS